MKRRKPRIAGLLAVKNYSDAWSALASLRALVDVTIVLDDDSSQPFPHRDHCDEYLSLRRLGLWNHLGNQTTLLYRAFVNDCDWVVFMDDDIVFSPNFQTRADVCRLVHETTRRGRDTVVFRLRDLWESEREYRYDGIWGRKGFVVLQKNWFFDKRITLREPSTNRLHRPIYPVRSRFRWRPNQTLREDYIAYHTGCLAAEQRAERVEKYRREDPHNEYQADYSYMLRTEGLRLEPVPEEHLRVIRSKFRPRG
jgi:hypothetical protein